MDKFIHDFDNGLLPLPAPGRFEKELERLINHHGIDSVAGTPDFILARFLRMMVFAFGTTVYRRQRWLDAGLPVPSTNLDQPTAEREPSVAEAVLDGLQVRAKDLGFDSIGEALDALRKVQETTHETIVNVRDQVGLQYDDRLIERQTLRINMNLDGVTCSTVIDVSQLDQASSPTIFVGSLMLPRIVEMRRLLAVGQQEKQ